MCLFLLFQLVKVKRRLVKVARLVVKGIRRSFHPVLDSPYLPSDINTVHLDGVARSEVIRRYRTLLHAKNHNLVELSHGKRAICICGQQIPCFSAWQT